MPADLSMPDRLETYDAPPRPYARTISDSELLANLRGWFGCDFELVDGETGEPTTDGRTPRAWNAAIGEMCRAVSRRGSAELIDDEEPLLVLAIPCGPELGRARVAIAPFVATCELRTEWFASAAERLGLSLDATALWLARQPRWSAHALATMGRMAVEQLRADACSATLESELREVSLELSTTYEEISLLHRLAQNLKLGSNHRELGERALEWLADVIPSESLAILWAGPADQAADDDAGHRLMTHGPSPVDAQDLLQIVEHVRLLPGQQPLIVNPPATQTADWPSGGVREMVIVPISEGGNCFGWLAAFNHVEGGQFGSVEASLLNSVAVMVGIHCGNSELYKQQREFFAGMVRALTSAIDAKDPYTCGHSDRVARTAVRLAEEMGCDRHQIETIYLSGLLHDVGKIGIDDTVLRKPGKLTEAEFEHIKTHTEIGYRILVDIKQLDEVLPVVLHHHEQWDGNGYPSGMRGEEIPLLARIVAVADAFDAMGSDRPYRQGMPDDKLDAIMRAGAGTQWDARVVEAFFRSRDDIRRIAREPVARVTLDVRR